MRKAWQFVTKQVGGKGGLQIEGVEFGETFAPVAKFNTIKVILALRMAMDLEMHKMDVKMVFLNSKLDVEIYTKQPEGFEQIGQNILYAS